MIPQGATPAAIWNNLGKESQVGASTGFDGAPIPDPGRAPSIFLTLLTGDPVHLPAGRFVTFQGVLLDPASASPKSVSVTNAVVLEVW